MKTMDILIEKKPNTVKIAIFYETSDWSWSELPEDCPEEYLKADLESRKALAAWFMTRGLKYYHSKKDDFFLFFYYGEHAIHDYFVAIIDLDISRPWKFYFPDDEEERWERICYLDNVDESNHIVPAVYPPV